MHPAEDVIAGTPAQARPVWQVCGRGPWEPAQEGPPGLSPLLYPLLLPALLPGMMFRGG